MKIPRVIEPSKKETHIIGVLDSSGSMGVCKAETINSFNTFVDDVKDNKDAGGDTFTNLVTFGEGRGDVRVKHKHIKAGARGKLNHLTAENYQPSGYTPMYDGIMKAIEIAERYDTGDGNIAFLVSIFTDGYENASKTTGEQLATKIKALQEKGNWTFTFAGANVDLDEIARNTGILRQNMISYAYNPAGIQSMMHNHSQGTYSYMGARAMNATATADFYNGSQVVNHTHTIVPANGSNLFTNKLKPAIIPVVDPLADPNVNNPSAA